MYSPLVMPESANFDDCTFAKYIISIIPERLSMLRSSALGAEDAGGKVPFYIGRTEALDEVIEVSQWVEEHVEMRPYTQSELLLMSAKMPTFAFEAQADKKVLTELSYLIAIDFGLYLAGAINASVEGCTWGCLKGGKLNVLRNHPVLFDWSKRDSFPPLQVGPVLTTKIARLGGKEARIVETLTHWIKAFSR